MAVDRFPRPEDSDREHKDPETEEDDEDEEESEESVAAKKKRGSFLTSWLKKEEGESSSSEPETADDKDKQSTWQKIGAFLRGSEEPSNVETAKPNDEQQNEAEGAPEVSEPEELYFEDPEAGEVDLETEPAEENPTVVFERRADGRLSTPESETEEPDAPEIPDDKFSEPEAEESPSPTIETEPEEGPETDIEPDVSPPADIPPPPERPPEPPEPSEEAEPPVSFDTAGGGAARTAEHERPVEIHEHNEYIERRGGGLSLADVLIYRNTSNKIRRQGKKIEELRRVDKSQEKRIDRLQNEAQELKSKVMDSAAEQPEARKPVMREGQLSFKPEAPKPVEKLIERIEKSKEKLSPVFNTRDRLKSASESNPNIGKANKPDLESAPSNNESWVNKSEQQQRPEKYGRGVETSPEAKITETEEPHELAYETSHESKQFTATALSAIVDQSEAKKLLEKAQAQRERHDTLISVASVTDPPREAPSWTKTKQTYQQAAIAGITAAVVLMAIIFLLMLLT